MECPFLHFKGLHYLIGVNWLTKLVFTSTKIHEYVTLAFGTAFKMALALVKVSFVVKPRALFFNVTVHLYFNNNQAQRGF